MAQAILELHLTCAAGREVECARHLWARVDSQHREILAALAAEVLSLRESAVPGSAVVVVTGSAQAERVLRDLQRDQPPLPVSPL